MKKTARSLRAVRLFLSFLVLCAVQGMLYTAHRGFDWPEIAIIASSGAAIFTALWMRDFPS